MAARDRVLAKGQVGLAGPDRDVPGPRAPGQQICEIGLVVGIQCPEQNKCWFTSEEVRAPNENMIFPFLRSPSARAARLSEHTFVQQALTHRLLHAGLRSTNLLVLRTYKCHLSEAALS